MKIVGYILLASVLLAILQSLAFVAAVLGLMALLWGACCRTRETFGLIGALLLFGLAAQSPGPFMAVVGVMAVVLVLTRRPDPSG